MDTLKLTQVSFSFPVDRGEAPRQVLCDINFVCAARQIVVVLGPSGCGKSTLLNLVAGLLQPTNGTILSSVGSDKTQQRVGYVFQSPSLVPWRTIRENALFGVEIADSLSADVRRRCDFLLRSYGLSGFEESFPSALSGGMQQRVSIIRAVLSGAKIVLLDEPFSNTDFVMRRELQRDLARLVLDEQLIAIFVTHDVEEAVRIGDKVIVLSDRPARVKAEVEILISRPERLTGGAVVVKEMASYVERVEKIFRSADDNYRPTKADQEGA